MSSAADRKRAKEAYLASLSQQRQQQQGQVQAQGPATDSGASTQAPPRQSVPSLQPPSARGQVVALDFSTAAAVAAPVSANPIIGSSKASSKRDEVFEQRRREFAEQQKQRGQQDGSGESGGQKPAPLRLTAIPEAIETAAVRNARPEPAVVSNLVPLRLPVDPVAVPDAPMGRGGGGRRSDTTPSPPKDRSGVDAVDERAAQRQRQNEYARQLQQDQQRQQQQNSSRDAGERHSSNASEGAAVIGGREADTRALQRQKQDEYARQLRMDQEQQQNKANCRGGGRNAEDMGGPSSAIGFAGADDDANNRAAQRRRQEEYSRQLQLDQVQQQRSRDSNYSDNRIGNNPALAQGGDPASGRMLQRQKQDEYARQLEMDQLQRRGGENQRGGNNNFGGDNGAPSMLPQAGDNRAAMRNKQDAYAQQLRQDQEMKRVMDNPQQYVGGPGYGGAPLPHGAANAAMERDRNSARAKQSEYARLLQQDQMIKSNIAGQGNGAMGRLSPTRNAAPAVGGNSSGQGGLSEGWVIGPLGIPVRKTIEVGHRGVQKAFNLAVQQQHPIEGGPFSPGRHAAYGVGNNDYGAANQAQFYQYSPPKPNVADPGQYYGGGGPMNFNAPAAVVNPEVMLAAVPGGAGALDLQQERDMAAKMHKVQHQKALEEQIRENKARVEKERHDAERREAELQHRLEMERQQLQLKYEQEKAQSRAEEERKRILAMQIEEKKQQKEHDELAAREAEERENRRIAREQQELMRREKEEIERERRASVSSVPPASAIGRPDVPSRPATTPRKPTPREVDLAPIEVPALDVSPVNISSRADRESLFDPKPPSRGPSARVPTPVVLAEAPPRPMSSQRQVIPEIVQRPESSAVRSRQEHRAQLFDSAPTPVAPSPRPTPAPTPAPMPSVDPAELKRMEREAALAKKEAEEAKKELERMRRVLADKERAAAEAKRQQEAHMAQELREARRRFEADLSAAQEAQRQQEEAAAAAAAAKAAVTYAPIRHESPLHGIFDMKLVGPNSEFRESASMTQTDELNNKTLKSDSRFVYPDGSAFAPSVQPKSHASPAKQHQKHSSKADTSRSPNKRSKARGETAVAVKPDSVVAPSREVETASSSSWHEVADGHDFYGEPRPFLPPRHLVRSVDASTRDSGGTEVLSGISSRQTLSSGGQHRLGNQQSQHNVFLNDPDLASRASAASLRLPEAAASTTRSIASLNAVRSSAAIAPSFSSQDVGGQEPPGFDVEGTLVKNRRKLKLLMDLDDTGAPGMDELDLLLSMKEASSRPSSSASSRPATVQGYSRLVHAYPHAESIVTDGPHPPRASHGGFGTAAIVATFNTHSRLRSDFDEDGEDGVGTETIVRLSRDFEAKPARAGGGINDTWARPSSSDLASSRRLRSAGKVASSLDAADSGFAGERDRTLAEERELLRARKQQYVSDKRAPASPSPKSPSSRAHTSKQQHAHHSGPQSRLERGAGVTGSARSINTDGSASSSFIDFSEYGF